MLGWDSERRVDCESKPNGVEPKAGSPIERDVGNYEQVVKCWVFLRKKQILAGEGDKDCPRLLK